MSIEPWNTEAGGNAGCEDMPRKSIDIRLTDRMGSGKARKWVKGQVPCGFLGQSPKPSESLSESISAIIKVQMSLFC